MDLGDSLTTAQQPRLAEIRLSIAFCLRVASNSSYTPVSTCGLIERTSTNLPVINNFLPPLWVGSLTTSQGEVRISDANLFDGLLPTAFSTRGLFPRSAPDPQIGSAVLCTAAEVGLLLDPLDASPSALRAPIRGGFLPAAVLLAGLSLSDWRPVTLQSESGLLFQKQVSCAGSTCPNLMVAVLRKLISESTQDVCPQITLVGSTLQATLGVDAFLTTDAITLRALSATTEGTFSCGTEGELQVRLSFTGAAAGEWPLWIYLTDATTGVGLAKSISYQRTGTISGSVVGSDGVFYSAMPGDLFSGVRAGLLIPDLQLPPNSADILSLVSSQVQALLSTGLSPLDDAVAVQFPIGTAAASLIQNYQGTTTNPTWHGLFQWLTTSSSSGLSMQLSADGADVSVLILVGVPETTVSSAQPFLPAIMQAIQTLCQQIDGPYFAIPQQSDISQAWVGVSGLLRARVTISGLLTGSPTVVLSSSLSTSAVVSAAISFIGFGQLRVASANVTYDFHAPSTTQWVDAELTYIGQRVGMSSSGALIWNTTYIPSPVANSLQDVVDQMNQLTWVTRLDPLNLNVGVLGTVPWSDIVLGLGDVLSQSLGEATIMSLAEAVQRYFHDLPLDGTSLNNMITRRVQVFPFSSPSADSLVISIDMHELLNVEVLRSTSGWNWITDTERFSVPTLIQTQLQFSLSATGGSLQGFSVSGDGQQLGFTIPFLYGMLYGITESGEVDIALNLPSSAALTMSMQVSTDYASGALQVALQNNGIGNSQSIPAQLVVTGSSRIISPSEILYNLQNGPFSTVSGVLNNTLPLTFSPLKGNLWGASPFLQSIEDKGQSLTLPANRDTFLVASETVCANLVTSAPSFNFTLNNYNTVSCGMSSLDTTSLTTLSASLSTSLRACGLASFLVAGVAQQDNNNLCGQIGLYATVPGVVSKLLVLDTDLPVPSNLTFSAGWSSERLPLFGSYRDLVQATSLLFTNGSSDSITPQFSTISATSVPNLVPLPQLYPDRLWQV